ncbi:MAG: PEP-CTERM sorting domain-containing protein [Deltaproteobacteria bacterium]|jgi:hypothetical protein|nr:PEP-CTERM sorting domain-containing protein [Deltaproteobacteria bacterium]
MKKIGILLVSFFLMMSVGVAGAVTLDFEDSTNLGVTLGGSMTWNGTGGGHLYCEQYNNDDYLLDLDGAYVNSFQMNAMPWENYGGGNIGQMDIEAFAADSSSIWSATVDLSNYTSWDNWLTVSVETDNVASITFYSPDESYGNGFWPSIDNMVINEGAPVPPDVGAPVPEPATMLLFGLGLLGLAGVNRKKQ